MAMPRSAALSPRPHTPAERGREKFLSALFQTCFALQAALDRRFLRFGVTFQEAAVLLRCVETGGITPGRLATALARDKGKITRFIDRLVARGFVVRDLNSRDRRFTLIKPTREGKLAARRLAVLFEIVRKELFANISDASLRLAAKTLPKLQRNAFLLGGRGSLAAKAGGRGVKGGETGNEAEVLAARADRNSAKDAPTKSGNGAVKRRTQRLSRAQIDSLFPR
jgi:DNA-binding MarR family transcriptional regulator